ncbi:MAG: endonuclease III, partial [Candidatus Adiutricales bacterium]
MRKKAEVKKILAVLDQEYPEAECTLDFKNSLELLMATILAAQCTDERVNKVTVDLFQKYRTAKDYAKSEKSELEEDIRSTGFFRNKAKSIQALGQALMDEYKGQVPASLEELVKLPGVGRKTANVVLGT